MVTVLVVEDEPHIRRLISAILQQQGYTVVEAVNGEEALRCLRGATFDMLITDIRMPTMDGVELTEKARQQQPDLPILVMSAYHTEAAQAIQHGATNFLPKPFSFDNLLSALAML